MGALAQHRGRDRERPARRHAGPQNRRAVGVVDPHRAARFGRPGDRQRGVVRAPVAGAASSVTLTITGAAGPDVSIVKGTAAEAGPTLPARSVSRAVALKVP